MRRDFIAFVGPTLDAAEARKFGCEVRPPARQGDVWRALVGHPRALVLIDGVFESTPSVWHHELRAALAAGVAVFGASSMGALRAAELGAEGMIGVGEIFRSYRDRLRHDDADVALLHAGPEHRFQAITVPLVNVEHAAAEAFAARLLTAAERKRVCAAARRLHYQHRHWPQVLDGARLAPEVSQRLRAWLKAARPDLKAADARECLAAAARWLRSGAPAAAPRRCAESSFVRRRRLVDAAPGALARVERWRDAEALADAGTRRALLAGWARAIGLLPEPRAVEHWLRRLPRAGIADDERARIAEDCALEALMLRFPERWLADGPSRVEGLADEARRLGRWKL